ncbi:related to HYS2 - DNA-directed DNA polymerase delta, 55 KD subunit [Melanopsichium pennsylvanicum]|uniref:Related to HYS2 - DNA-directed DNA polymerase delta, 55 KD subunit n=2 Tax=Melanopsichium pennsylvanicum TaxID=63383 RepID=A0AAJ4XQ63_9BASI|nr:related to HYS2-DNA-directed DNA polymerase delta, 55 KD subunit [Melanopsichium pennsylvanicum 4]SNX86449.1 related to HYS2 - DNA-directed DNA polymerase delta, 55 KD subunit [Melanopsichium pennsylvanicum]
MSAVIERQSAPATSDTALATDLDKAFLVPLGSRSYSKQYAQLYDYRLAYLKKRILPRAQSRWIDNFEAFSQSQSQPSSQLDLSDAGPSSERVRMHNPPKFVDRILDVRQGDICYIVGNIYCAMPLKPDVLEDLTREQWLAPQPVRPKFVDYTKDELFIEDQSGRVKLVGDAIQGGTSLRSMLITGVVAAVLGTETRAGDFDVVDAVFASLPTSSPPKSLISNGNAAKKEAGADQWIVLMSGLAIGGETALESELSMQLLTEYLTGELGSDTDRNSTSNIVAAVIAGNSLAPPTRTEEEEKPKRYGQDQPTFSSAPTLALDQLLTDLCSTMPVHILPGEHDPASAAIPQQPIHFALLPRAGRFDSLNRHTNPAWLSIGETKLLGTSGQNIDDIYKYVDEPDSNRIEMALRTLEWGHLAPTAPDTLWCYPFKSSDPFVLKQRPDVLFVGNQPSYATAVYRYDDDNEREEQCRVVLVPQFAKTNEVVLLNLRTLETVLVSIKKM